MVKLLSARFFATEIPSKFKSVNEMSLSKKSSKASFLFQSFKDIETVLKGFLRRFVSNKHDIEGICQEAITRALEAEKSRQIKDPRAFLFGVSKNIVRKRLDKQSRSLIDYIEDFTPKEYVSETEISIDEIIDDRRRMVVFTDAVLTLPRQCQRVFVLKKVYGYSHQEIASKLGISISTTEKHVAMGLKRCSAFMRNKYEAGHSIVVHHFKDVKFARQEK